MPRSLLAVNATRRNKPIREVRKPSQFARLPWHRRAQTRILIETTMDERVLKPTQKRTLIYDYGEPFDVALQVYGLEELVAEKMRAMLRHTELLRARGWSRSTARDHYDLWRILGAHKDQMDLSAYEPIPPSKVRRPGRQPWIPKGLLRRSHAHASGEHLGTVARPPGTKASRIQNGDREASPGNSSPGRIGGVGSAPGKIVVRQCPSERTPLDGYPEDSSAPYRIAENSLLAQSQAYRQQYGMNSVFLVRVNLRASGIPISGSPSCG